MESMMPFLVYVSVAVFVLLVLYFVAIHIWPRLGFWKKKFHRRMVEYVGNVHVTRREGK